MTDITLITGANKGIGRETARQLHNNGHTVILGARNPKLGAAAATDLGVEFVHLDVTDQDSVNAAIEQVDAQHGRLDVLINNAGITGAFTPIERGSIADAQDVLNTNLLGVMRVTNACISLLAESKNARIVNVSSGVGSLHDTVANDYSDWRIVPPVYAISKTAVTMLTLKYAHALPSMRVNAADPGYTRTDLNAGEGAHDVDQGAAQIVRLASVSPDGPTGTVSNLDGVLPW